MMFNQAAQAHAQAQQAAQASNTSAIDFNAMMRQEQLRATQTLTLKPTTAQNVFNMLQDMRHLIILDLRESEAFAASHIRKSLHVTVDSFKDQLVAAFLSQSGKDERFRSHYAVDDLKRVLVILPTENATRLATAVGSALTEADNQVTLASGKMTRIHKAFSMKDYESAFKTKYPLLCLSSNPADRTELKEVRAQSRFPSEIKKDSLYLGNMTNILNRDYFQLHMLGIKTVFYLTQGPFTDIDQHFNCVHIEVNELEKPSIDFDDLSQQVQTLMKNPETGPVLILCVSGQLSGALAMKVSMDTNASFASHPQIASTYVMQRRYELKDIEPWLFSQVRPFDAKKAALVKQKSINAQQQSETPASASARAGAESSGSDSEETKEADKAALLERIAKYKANNADLQRTEEDGQAATEQATSNCAEESKRDRNIL